MQTNQPFSMRYGPWAMVAGASQGLGAEYARQLAQRGLNLLLVARRAEQLQALGAEIEAEYKVQVRTQVLDLSTPEAAPRLAESCADLDLGLVVYNAAYSAVGPFLNTPLEGHLKEIDTNIRTPVALIHLLGPRLAGRGHGGVILMSSLSAFQGSAYVSSYAASKAFNQILGEGLWEEWREKGVDVVVCTAGAIRTPTFLSSQPRSTGGISDMTSDPAQVAAAALAALGRQPFVIPGLGNRLASFVMRHLLPRAATIRMMGRVLRQKYG